MLSRGEQEKYAEELLRQQFSILAKINPFILLLLLIADALYVIVGFPRFDSAFNYGPPMLFALIAVVRGHYWLKVGQTIGAYDIDGIRRMINRAMAVAAVLSILAAVETALIIMELDGERRIAAISVVVTTVIVCSFSLSIVPQIAIAILASAFGPIVCLLATSNNFALQFTAASSAILAVAQIWMILRRFNSFKKIVISNEQLRDAQARLEAAERAARLQAHTDCLTGFHNRHGFDALVAEAELNQSGRLAIALIDLDGFKEINDRYGHAAGDRLLQLVAARLHDNLHQFGEFVRFGGDEFAVLCRDETWFPLLQEALDGAIEELKRPFRLNGEIVRIGASSGLCVGECGESVKNILAAADRALYDAKREGKGRNKMARQETPVAARAASWTPPALIAAEFTAARRPALVASLGRSRYSHGAH